MHKGRTKDFAQRLSWAILRQQAASASIPIKLSSRLPIIESRLIHQAVHDRSYIPYSLYSRGSTCWRSQNFSSQPSPNLGQKCYDQALEALRKVEELQEDRERKKSEEVHRAIEKADERQKQHADNPKAASLKGVTVVKTIVKQTRKERKIAKHDDEEFWKAEAEKLLKMAALTYEHPQALLLLGNQELKKANKSLENDRNGAKQAVNQALDLYTKAGENGSAEGWFNLGQLLWTGYPALDDGDETDADNLILVPDKEQSMNAFRKSIDLGDPDAMYFVGVHLLSADENNRSPEVKNQMRQGLELIEESAKHGHGPAKYYLALFYLNGNEALDIEPCSSAEFIRLLNDATEAGDADALFLRGHSYHEGDNGYPQDYSLAFQDFIDASGAGNADAAISAGAMLHQGRPGLKKDQVRAFDLYQRAGEMGSLEGWRNVAACYALGEGVPKSEATARYIINTMLKDD